ncbi:uncharacterized protein F5891DRAFT_1174617, partial [Suillus fuscotomentosus]
SRHAGYIYTHSFPLHSFIRSFKHSFIFKTSSSVLIRHIVVLDVQAFKQARLKIYSPDDVWSNRKLRLQPKWHQWSLSSRSGPSGGSGVERWSCLAGVASFHPVRSSVPVGSEVVSSHLVCLLGAKRLKKPRSSARIRDHRRNLELEFVVAVCPVDVTTSQLNSGQKSWIVQLIPQSSYLPSVCGGSCRLQSEGVYHPVYQLQRLWIVS